MKKWIPSLLWSALFLGILNIARLQVTSDKEARTINVFSWPEIVPSEKIKAFEKESGIHVNFTYFHTNEELLTKLKKSGKSDYDLVVLSDYAVPLMIKEGLAKPIDKTRCLFVKRLLPELLGRDYDPKNTYSLPFEWDIYGFAIDQNDWSLNEISWKDVFTRVSSEHSITMVDDPVEAVNLAAFYLYGPVSTLKSEQTKAVEELLRDQRTWVEAYVKGQAAYLLATHNCSLAVTSSSYVFKTAQQFPSIQFVLPKSWSFTSIENVVLTKDTEKDDMIYTFLNYMFRPDVLEAQSRTYFTFPATRDVMERLDPIEHELFIKSEKAAVKRLKNSYSFRYIIPEKNIRDLWVNVKR